MSLRCCLSHWKAMREAVVAHGLEHLIAKSEAELRARDAQVDAGNAAAIEPLQATYSRVLVRFSVMVGDRAFQVTAAHPWPTCVLCLVQRDRGDPEAPVDQAWIDAAAADVFAECRAVGAVVLQ